MTSIPHNGPRPPPRPDLLRSRTSSGSAFRFDTLTGRLTNNSSISRNPEEQNGGDFRPLKRRKTEHDVPTDASITEPAPVAAEGTILQPKSRLIGDLRLLSAVLAGQTRDEAAAQNVEPPPLPTPPWRMARSATVAEESKSTHRARAILEVPCTPDTSGDTVTAAPLGNKAAGYFPWVGRHPEDVLSEGNVKQGYYDRPPNPPDRELSSSRVPLYNAFKHKSGIESLSTLLTLVLEAKNMHGLLSSASTFKPPPRVTLAEAKRKSWIADLADSSVPLRKLSRTIPQGIRGQMLLDQCLQNSVPLSRAIWFAKCVGANEIRTLKRKGTTAVTAAGTESKWLRDWTINVEQFVEAILVQVGHTTWRTSLQYVLRLTTRLYLENLIDRDHYVDWIIRSFSSADNDRLPFWLMVLHIFKQDISGFRKQAKKLVQSLVDKYRALKDSKNDLTQSLVLKLRSAIRGFVMNRAQCFISPDSWPSLREGLASCLNAENLTEAHILDHLDRANERCMRVNRQQKLSSPDPAELVINVLDSAKAPYDPTSLFSTLSATSNDVEVLVSSCLEWATTKFRCGSARIYLTARMLRKWDRQGYDVETVLLDFVTKCRQSSGPRDYGALKHLMAELSRSHTFPTSKYLQWLNVRGLPRAATCTGTAKLKAIILQQCSETSEVLIDLSLSDVKSHLINQRNALLARAGFEFETESTAIEGIQAELEQALTNVGSIDGDAVKAQRKLQALLDGWNWNVRIQISHWLRSVVATKVRQHTSPQNSNPLKDTQPINARGFEIVRTALETLGEEAVLADVVGLCSAIDDERLQAALVETITRHGDAFSAMGALDHLRTRLCTIYMSLRGVKSTMPLFATALFELCSAYPTKSLPTRLLQQDLVRGDRGRAVAACSPFSDGIAESLQQAESTFIEDFEAVLQSEPSMNAQTMTRLFALLTERIGKQAQGGSPEILFTYCQLMARLRHCRQQQGDQLIKMWLMKLLYRGSNSFMQSLVFSLIGTGGLSLDIFAEAMSAVGSARFDPGQLLPGEATMDHDCHYAVVSKWEAYARCQPAEVFKLISDASEARTFFDGGQLCTSLVFGVPEQLSHLTPPANRLLEDALDTLLDTNAGPSTDLKAMFQSVDTTSLPFVKARLQLLSQTSDSMDNDAVAQGIKDLVFDESAAAPSGRYLSLLLQGTGSDLATNVQQLVQEHVIDFLPKLPAGKGSENDEINLDGVQYAVDQASLICQDGPTVFASTMAKLVDKFSQLLKYFGQSALPASPLKVIATSPTSAPTPQMARIASQMLNPSSPMDPTPRSDSSTVFEYYRILLRLLCLLRPINQPNNDKQPAQQKSQSDQIKILILLATITTHPFMTSPSAVFPAQQHAIAQASEALSFTYDIMATYVDDLSDDARVLCAKILKDKLRDDREGKLKWLFGSVNFCGSEMKGGEEMGKGLLVVRKGEMKGDWKPRVWEVLEGGGRGSGDGETSLGLGLFGARR